MTTTQTPGPGTPAQHGSLETARQLLTALSEHARSEGERTRAEVALAHLDDVEPLPHPADTTGVEARGADLLDDAISAVIYAVNAADDAQGRARALRALDVVSSCLDLLGHRP